ncbi:recombinase family protein [Streptosporangium sp. CA-135522]|uniref:recombinase family protein n=1 Tax=Streptosporangium sp. CA-135522 TaxID=3240072 RepID=UPI003D942C21
MVADILALRPALIRRGLPLRVESGLLSGIDLAGDDPGTKMMVSVLAAVLEFQRDMISESTREGVAAAEAAGKTLGRPAALDKGKAATVVEVYRQGAAVKALARRHQVTSKAIRRVLDATGARDLPDQLGMPPASQPPRPPNHDQLPRYPRPPLILKRQGEVAVLRRGSPSRPKSAHPGPTDPLCADYDLRKPSGEAHPNGKSR